MTDSFKEIGRKLVAQSIKSAIKEQNLKEIYERLEGIVPDISDQYSTHRANDEFYQVKIRGLHAFQIFMVGKALGILGHDEKEDLNIIDIGDSSGNHILYLKEMYKRINSLSINLDRNAVEKIRMKGLRALQVRAEELESHSIKPDVLLSFEMLEHLHDPCNFLKKMSETNARLFIVTVPYLRQSRVGLHHIRKRSDEKQNGETTHLFELSPEDWKLIFRHSGWEIAYERIYLQYPKFHVLRMMRDYFRKRDFEGFYGVILKPEPYWKDRYADW